MQVQGELTQRRFRVYTHETAPRKIEQLELCGMLSHNEKVSPGKELLKPVGFCEWGRGNFSWCPKVALGSMGKTQKALLQEIVDNQNRNNPAYGQFMREQEEERAKSRADFDKAMSQLPRQVITAYALWIPSILGFGGLHRFYTRHWLSGMGLLFLGLSHYFIHLIRWFWRYFFRFTLRVRSLLFGASLICFSSLIRYQIGMAHRLSEHLNHQSVYHNHHDHLRQKSPWMITYSATGKVWFLIRV